MNMTNFDFKFKKMNEKIDAVNKDMESLAIEYMEARDFTQQFLDCCRKHNISGVSIERWTDKIESAKEWGNESDMVYSDAIESEDAGPGMAGWPSIWHVCSEMDISKGCGNKGQHQANCSRLIAGVYRFTEDGRWIRLEDEKDEEE